jgi:hypothetical protein
VRGLHQQRLGRQRNQVTRRKVGHPLLPVNHRNQIKLYNTKNLAKISFQSHLTAIFNMFKIIHLMQALCGNIQVCTICERSFQVVRTCYQSLVYL